MHKHLLLVRDITGDADPRASAPQLDQPVPLTVDPLFFQQEGSCGFCAPHGLGTATDQQSDSAAGRIGNGGVGQHSFLPGRNVCNETDFGTDKTIQTFRTSDLKSELPLPKIKDESYELIRSFNEMIVRLNGSFERKNEFLPILHTSLERQFLSC